MSVVLHQKDEALEKVIDAIPQQAQRQYSADEQLQYLRAAANRLGLYDAADRLPLVGESVIAESTYKKLHTFGEAKHYLAEGHPIDYEVRVCGHNGALMTREEWLDAVRSNSFIDYDGMGNELAEDGTILGAEPGKHGWIKPSEASRIRPETKYILWYNR
jgi:hypothetical protein